MITLVVRELDIDSALTDLFNQLTKYRDRCTLFRSITRGSEGDILINIEGDTLRIYKWGNSTVGLEIKNRIGKQFHNSNASLNTFLISMDNSWMYIPGIIFSKGVDEITGNQIDVVYCKVLNRGTQTLTRLPIPNDFVTSSGTRWTPYVDLEPNIMGIPRDDRVKVALPIATMYMFSRYKARSLCVTSDKLLDVGNNKIIAVSDKEQYLITNIKPIYSNFGGNTLIIIKLDTPQELATY